MGEDRRVREGPAPYYDFEMLHGDEVIAVKRMDLPGCGIRVRENSGETITLIGAVAARRYPHYAFCS